ncbi:hypothetical protein NBRC110019_21630 [Neptunitalea chrysea]|uniref:histidine kinase n=1 Tax=Neptunitalea chrysea TaxID=1647581 RepID=A0A9W6EWK8_9FLAO|nr:sensor histidine kinase [Neptunitalea chrysea]GLB53123.1 hypothetical protein NBRC110019_21630 [Neptunitalea chrysea]
MESLFSDGYGFLTIIVIAVILLLVMSLTLILFFYLSRKKIIKKEMEKQKLVIDHQKEMLLASIETQEEERKRIAQDLHDDISSKLNVVSLNAQFLLEEDIEGDELKQMLNQVLQITNTTLDTSRKIAHNLLPPVLERFGLGAAIEEACDEYHNSKKVSVTLNNNYKTGFLKEENELHMFRIVQELLNNSLKHGKAKHIVVNVTTDQIKGLLLVYKDDGQGFDAEKAMNKKGLGLQNIESRLDILKGSITYKSKPGEGVLATIKV